MSGATPARRVAYEVLRRVFEHGAWADRALRSAADRGGLERRDRAHAQRLAYGAVQRRGTSDHVIDALSGRPIEAIDAPLLAALRLGLYELLFEPDAGSHAAVHQAVELAKGGAGAGRRRQRGAGLVNAVLRRSARERDQLLAALDDATPAGAAVAHSLPLWIAELWWRELGADRARSLGRAINRPPELTFRLVDGGGGKETAMLDRLRAEGVEAEAVGARGLLRPAGVLRIAGGPWGPVERAVTRGRLVPQSRASAAVADVLAPAPGERVLDLCAAPGMKTTQIAARVGPRGSVVAVESDPTRAALLAELCERTGAGNVEVRVGDARTTELGGHYDRVLVDAPCSGLGTLASRPDLRWRREPADVERMADLGEELLDRAVEAARPGGSVVLSLCTISRREGAELVARRAGADRRLELDDLGSQEPGLAERSDPRFLQTLPDRDGTDGFFVARIRRVEGR